MARTESPIVTRGWQYLVVAKHGIGQHQQGDAMSWHKSHDAAQRAAKPVQYAAVWELDDAIQDAEAKSL